MGQRYLLQEYEKNSIPYSFFLRFLSLLIIFSPWTCEAFLLTSNSLQTPRYLISAAGHFKASDQDSFDFNSNDDNVASERKMGLLVLLTVPMAWGTFEPAVRYVYEIQPNVPPFVFSFAYYLVATTALSSLALNPFASKSSIHQQQEDDQADQKSDNEDEKIELLPIRGGIELGTYLFIGNALQVVGLKTEPADRAAVLLQLTTIFVPLVQSILERNLFAISAKTWISCFIALSGVAIIGLDESSVDATSISSLLHSLSLDNVQFSIGDFYIMCGALFYTFHCIRLEIYAKNTTAINLAACKASTETMWCVLVIAFSYLVAVTSHIIPVDNVPFLEIAQSSGDNIIAYKNTFLNSIQDHDNIISYNEWFKLGAATVWIGLITVGYTIYAQSFGQSRVPPTTANLVYTIQPFFTALVAFLVLGEKPGHTMYIGGILIGSAVLLVIQENDEKQNNLPSSRG